MYPIIQSGVHHARTHRPSSAISPIRFGRRVLRSMSKRPSFTNGNNSKPQTASIIFVWPRENRMDLERAGSLPIWMPTNGWTPPHGSMHFIRTQNLPPLWIHSSPFWRVPRCPTVISLPITKSISRVNAGSTCKWNTNFTVTDISSKQACRITKQLVVETCSHLH